MNPTSAATMLLTWCKGQGMLRPRRPSAPLRASASALPIRAGLASATTVPSIVAPARAKPIAPAGRPPIPWADVGDERLGGAAALHDVADQDAGEQPHADLAGGRREEPDRLTRAAMPVACVVIGRPTIEEHRSRAWPMRSLRVSQA